MTYSSTNRTRSGLTERWLDVPGYEGRFQVSDQGRVRSLPRRGVRGGVMSPVPNHGGYLTVCFSRDAKGKSWLVHRLIATAFIGPPEPGQVCRHLNHDRTDNRPSNLAWGSTADNMADMLAAGRHNEQRKDCCVNGHPFDAENTYVYLRKNGRANRRCRACHRDLLAQPRACPDCGQVMRRNALGRHQRRVHPLNIEPAA